ncbi:hypothetical protein NDI76_04025 [Halogeometricum sp. S1BR25-6]|uniref:Uncharacterized protein n=1 Tax=Halogeometricum salsisoli TaxID=2950536 RepID=A0ABU2GAT1_9EURY|nr:hypothetical protein [Halogeometricum sp. S1BR25-6]MDS0297900.1 hypothetical protein [Halogeometricum sp. S1BR25-6]
MTERRRSRNRNRNRGRSGNGGLSTDRAQLATPMVEVTVGLLFVLAVVAGFALAPVETGDRRALDRTASDALAILVAEAPEGDGADRLAAACESPSSFVAEADALNSRLDAILPAPLSYRLETPYGPVGPPRPTGVPTGRAWVTTDGCTATLWVWYV